MKMLIFILLILILNPGCSVFVCEKKPITFFEKYIENNPNLKDEWKEEFKKGNFPKNLKMEDVENIFGKDCYIYKSTTGMMEVWVYDEFFIGFDKNKKVIKFKTFEDKKEVKK